MQHRWCLNFPLIVVTCIALFLLVSCTSQTVVVTVTTEPELIVVTATPMPASVPTSGPEPNMLTICLDGEPDTLYLYGGSHLPATQHVLVTLYDGPIDYVNYEYQPVILEKLPSVADGDAVIRRTRVYTGDRVVDSFGAVVNLEEGMRVRPAGCYADACAVEFDGQGLFMEKLEVTFVFRDDLKWSDGTLLTAEDSVFAYKIVSNPDTPGRRFLADRTVSYRALDEQRVKWMGLPGFIPADYVTNFFAPLPVHQLQGRSPRSLLSDAAIRRTPLSWGPYAVEEWVPGDRMILARNPFYFRADDGLPVVDRILFRFMSGAEGMVSELIAGGCDVVVNSSSLDSLIPLLQQLDSVGLVNLVAGPSDGGWQMDFGITPAAEPRRGSLFADPSVRQAFVQCIDRRSIVDQATAGLGVEPDGLVPPGHPLFADATFANWDYNPVAGRALLGNVGWVDEDGDGIIEANDVAGVQEGAPFEVTLFVPVEDDEALQAAQMISANMIDCGVRIDVEPVFYEDLISPGPDGLLYGRRFDLALTRWDGEDVRRCDRYLSSEIPAEERWNGTNVTGFVNLDYDAVCMDALGMLPGMRGYAAGYREIQTILSDELPSLSLFFGARVALTRPGVSGFVLDATSGSLLWNIEEIVLE